MDVHLVFFDEVEQEIERAFEDFEADFIVVGFHGAGGRVKIV
jgi:nucleotide-binding universal stress UspA family protein